MRYLLDTHAVLWALLDPARLSRKAVSLVIDGDTDVSVSALCFWEISLKFGLGKLTLRGVTPDELPAACSEAGLSIAPLGVSILSAYHKLPRGSRRDPFDRLLVWQCIQDNFTLLSGDSELDQYASAGLRREW